MSDDLIKAGDGGALEPAGAGNAPAAAAAGEAPVFRGPAPLQGMLALPVVKQVGLMLGLAASVALGIAVVLWSQTPDYRLLYAGVDGRDAQRMIEVLEATGIPYRLDAESGALLVAADRINDARLKLAGENLTPTRGQGFEILDKESGFGSSTFMQSVRYKRAQEGELARTIMSINAVQTARVHLAIPKDSAFVRNRRKPSASVMVKLAPGRRLTAEQITSIVNLVAASVPNLTAEGVTLVDDKGRLLSSGERDRDLLLTASQFDYTRKVEQTYAERIENILGPLVGLHAVRATVNADIDFTVTELTQERFNPDLLAMRSEQQFEESSSGGVVEGGIPGALSNTPPGPAAAPEQVNPEGEGSARPEPPKRSVKRTTRNYELDKTISHTRRAPGTIRKLSVAVVLDVPTTTDEEGNVIPQPYSDEQLARFTELVREAVGFNALRGDSVKVINAPFNLPPPPEVPEEAIWEKPWFGSVVRQVLAGLLVLVLLFGVLRPVMRSLAKPPVRYVTENGEEIPEDQVTLSEEGAAAAELEGGSTGQGRLPKPTSYEDNLNMAKQLASQEPKRVALVVKNWLEDG